MNSRHQCFIYEGAPSVHLPAMASTIQQKLNEGYRCLYMNSRPMVSGLRSCLSSLGTDVAKETASGRLILSSESVVSGNEDFNSDLMLQKLEDSCHQALKDGYKGLFATGDMAWEFGAEKNFSKLLDYEFRLEKLFRKCDSLHGICQYHKDSLPADVPRTALLSHQSIYVNNTLSRLNPLYVPIGLAADRIPTNSELDQMITSLCEAVRS